MAVVVGGMIAIKIIQSQFQLTTRFQPPGPARGDLELRDECLPETMAGWQKQGFTPPQQEVPEGQRFWTHSWLYQCKFGSAIVAFDQAGFTGWHELSQCYAAQGWTLENREIREDKSGNWNYVVSEFSKPPNQSGLVVFSLFFKDGSPVQPPELSIHQAIRQNMSWLERIDDRLDNLTAKSTDPALQCQTFVPTSGPLDPALIEQAIQLHLESRQLFVQQSLNEHSQNAATEASKPESTGGTTTQQ